MVLGGCLLAAVALAEPATLATTGQGRGPTLLFLHGMGGTRDNWKPAVEKLSGYHVVLADLPGHGRSSLPDPFSLEAAAEQVAATLRTLKAESTVVVGQGIGGVLALRRLSSATDNHILRLEKSINIGRPVEAVFDAWSDFELLPQYIDFVERVERFGRRSRWTVNIDGKRFRWDAQITQVVRGQSIGWKSLSGPRHTGRISFAPLGDQTVVHVTMNYAPPLGKFGSMLPMDQHLEDWIERALREFKAKLEHEERREISNA